MTISAADTIAVLLTLAVLSRVLGEHPVYRAVQSLFIGTSLGVAFVITYHTVLAPAVRQLLAGAPDSQIAYAIPLVLGLLLFTRLRPGSRLAWLSNLPLGLVFGVAAGLAVSGAVLGSIVPQILSLTGIDGAGAPTLIGFAGITVTILVLIGFSASVADDHPAGAVINRLGAVGRWCMVIAFGGLFAAGLQSYSVALLERVRLIIDWLARLTG
ncbi:MAG: hypothetical protein KGS47_12850 [Chloroflexi bacterium]|nr:hypothetical protein [Chloroflexota bacterium]